MPVHHRNPDVYARTTILECQTFSRLCSKNPLSAIFICPLVLSSFITGHKKSECTTPVGGVSGVGVIQVVCAILIGQWWPGRVTTRRDRLQGCWKRANQSPRGVCGCETSLVWLILISFKWDQRFTWIFFSFYVGDEIFIGLSGIFDMGGDYDLLICNRSVKRWEIDLRISY